MLSTKLQFLKQKGVSLLFIVLIMSVILAISLGISSILGQQMIVMRTIGYSVIAFYAADTGIERVLMEADPKILDGFEGELNNGAKYLIVVKSGGEGDCDPERNYCIKSTGSYQEEIKRAIEIRY
jgi:hypothetical protein